jgi:PRTRC genetic system ThiF family protein
MTDAVHYAHPYLLQANGHPITVALIGAGGTGSQMLRLLGQIHCAMIGLGRPGLQVTVYDPDTVSEANVGRQLFSPADVGRGKAELLVYRVNAFFGTQWEWRQEAFTTVYGQQLANILITCVDRADFRVSLHHYLASAGSAGADMTRALYWLDLGNSRHTGQAVLGTVSYVMQPTASAYRVEGFLPNVTDLFANLLDGDNDDQGPSCSMAEALLRQDLLINSAVALQGASILWELLREGRITRHASFINQTKGIVLPRSVTVHEVRTTYELESCRPLPGEVEFATAQEAKERAVELVRQGFRNNISVCRKNGPFRYGGCVKHFRRKDFEKRKNQKEST